MDFDTRSFEGKQGSGRTGAKRTWGRFGSCAKGRLNLWLRRALVGGGCYVVQSVEHIGPVRGVLMGDGRWRKGVLNSKSEVVVQYVEFKQDLE